MSIKKNLSKFQTITELNQVLPKYEKLFYNVTLGATSFMSYTTIELSITNEDNSKEYVKMAINSALGGNDEIRIMIHNPFQVLQIQRPSDEGLKWLLDEIFPCLEASVRVFKKPEDSSEN